MIFNPTRKYIKEEFNINRKTIEPVQVGKNQAAR